MPESSHRKRIAQMEEYIWAHWKTQRSGCLSTQFITLEGDTVNTWLFFERDDHGVWRIRLERKRNLSYYGWRGHRYITTSTYFAYSVSRADEKEFSKGTTVEIADSENLAPGSYVMLFMDREGETIYNLEPGNISN
jgi:hypothetical protein